MTQIDYRKKVLGAWLGKAVGGTLGQPWEGCDGPLSLSFYDPVPEGMMPNDDLDLQVVWACRLAGDWKGVVSYRNFSDAWLNNIGFACDEYGVVIRNLKLGIPAPYTGRYDNWFVDGLGGAIRSEIWAVLAPGNPERAAKLAGIDASLDHYGNGVFAEQFLAAVESKAFVENDINKLIECGLSMIPADSLLHHAISQTAFWCKAGMTFAAIRSNIMKHFGSSNFTDVKMNLSFLTAALLLGNGDFEKTICTAVNFGQDADCTGASAGAIMGILNPDSIPERWLSPIGEELMLNEGIVNISPPGTLTEFSDLVISLKDKIQIAAEDVPEPDFSCYKIPFKKSVYHPWFARDFRKFKPELSAETTTFSAPGNLFTVDFAELLPESLLMLQTEFVLAKEQVVKVLVNTPANMRVWVDGEFCFGRECGAMVPAFHRALLNQMKTVTLNSGRHTLLIGLAPANPDMKQVELFFGIADEADHWLPGIFYERK